MKDSQPIPTKAEMEILQVLWKLGSATVRQIHEQIGRGTAYTTVLKMLQIMTEKGIVSREVDERAHVYKPRLAQKRATGAFVGELVERVFGGSAQQLVLHALSSRTTTAEELKEIREIIEKLEKQ